MKRVKWIVVCVLFLILCFVSGIGMISMGDTTGYLQIFCSILLTVISIYLLLKEKEKKEARRWEEEAKKKEEARRQERIDKLNQDVKDGKWVFPVDKFYQLCRDSHATALDNEFSMRKATQIAEHVIKETAPDIDLANCGEYLKKESLEEFLRRGESIITKHEAASLLAEKQPRNANPIDPEKKFIERASELSRLSGCDKRAEMLSNLSNDYSKKIIAMREGEEALKQLGMIYASQQKKESSWAVMGGIAEGIAGPAAGIMAASNTMENNRKIREYNASVRKASMDIMSGIPSVAGDRYQLEEERDKIDQKRNEAKNKVVLSKPAAEEIWQNIKAGKATVKKNPSGVLEVALPITIQKPFALDVPDGVGMVVDGTIKGEVWFEDKLVGQVFFPLPIYGIPSNMTAEVALDGMCGRSVGFDGEYTVKIADTQNLWIMEA